MIPQEIIRCKSTTHKLASTTIIVQYIFTKRSTLKAYIIMISQEIIRCKSTGQALHISWQVQQLLSSTFLPSDLL